MEQLSVYSFFVLFLECY